MEPIRAVKTELAALPLGHYSQALVYNGIVYVSGQLGLTPGPLAAAQTPGSIEDQTERALRNVQAILRAAGSDLDRLLKVTLYVSNIELWDRVNAVYMRVLGEHRPARAVVPCGPLHLGFQVAIDAIAATKV